MDGLPGQLADVRYHTVAVGKALLLRELRDDRVDMTDHSLIFRRDLGSGGKMLLRDDEEMCGGKGADVLEGIAEVVLVDLCGRDLTRDDFAEQAIRHGASSLVLDIGRDVIVDSRQRVVELEGVRAAAHGGIRLAAALAADDGRNILDDIARLDAACDGVFAADGQQRDLFAVDSAESRDGVRVLVAQEIAELTQVVRVGVLAAGRDDLEAVYVLGGEHEAVHIACEELVLHALDGLVQLTDLVHAALGLVDQLHRRGLQQLGSLDQAHIHLIDEIQERFARDGLDAAHAGGNRGFARDAERADLGGVIDMGAAAKLNGLAAHVHDAHDIAVLFAEQGDRAELLRLRDGHFLRLDGHAVQHKLTDKAADLDQLVCGDGGEVCEVVAQAVRLDKGACLMGMVAENRAQSIVQQMRCGVGAHDGLAAGGIDGRGHGIADGQRAGDELAVVHELAALVLLHVGDGEFGGFGVNGAMVGDLAAHFGVERGLVEDKNCIRAGRDRTLKLFIGYTNMEAEGKIVAIVADEELQGAITAGTDAILVLDQTPFYAEMGGQVADHGVIRTETAEFTVTDVQKNKGGKFMHYGKLVSGSLSVGDTVTASIDEKRRKAIMRAHSATHLLDYALRTVLGDHAHQAGSLVEPDRLRYDFTHFSAVTADELVKISRLVSELVLGGMRVETKEMPIDEAKKLGAIALFGEKYGDVVRVVNMGGKSIELCGGTHVDNTAKVGPFRITSESSVASGVRRIEAVTGEAFLNLVDEMNARLVKAAEMLKTTPMELINKAQSSMNEIRELHQTVEKMKDKLFAGDVDSLMFSAKDVSGLKVVTASRENTDANDLRKLGDFLRDKNPNTVAALGSVNGEKVTLLAVCGKNAIARGVKAGDIIRNIAPIVGGKGGGKPDSAMGGGTNALKLDDALAAVDDFVSANVKE